MTDPIPLAAARLCDPGRQERWAFRLVLAKTYADNRSQFFREYMPDLLGFQVWKFGQNMDACTGDIDFTVAMIHQLHDRLRQMRLRLCADHGEVETLYVVLLGEIEVLRRQRGARATVEGLAHLGTVLDEAQDVRE